MEEILKAISLSIPINKFLLSSLRLKIKITLLFAIVVLETLANNKTYQHTLSLSDAIEIA